MTRIKMEKGQQRALIAYAMQRKKMNLRELSDFLKEDYERMKKYYQEVCFFSRDVFDKLCKVGEVKISNLIYESLDDDWGKVLGGKRRQNISLST